MRDFMLNILASFVYDLVKWGCSKALLAYSQYKKNLFVTFIDIAGFKPL